jgi:hypothetical protein
MVTARQSWHDAHHSPPRTPIVNPANPAANEALRQFRLIFGAVRQHFQTVEKPAG